MRPQHAEEDATEDEQDELTEDEKQHHNTANKNDDDDRFTNNFAKQAQDLCIHDISMNKLTKVPDEHVGSYLSIFDDFSVETPTVSLEVKAQDDEDNEKLLTRLQQVCDKLKSDVSDEAEVNNKELLFILKTYVDSSKILSYCNRAADDFIADENVSAIEQLCNLDDESFFSAFPLTDTDFVNLESNFYAHTVAQFQFEEPQIGHIFSGCRLVLPVKVNDAAMLRLVKSVCKFNISVDMFLKTFPIFVTDPKLNWIETNIEILLGKKKNLYVKYYGCLPSNPHVLRLIVSILPNSQNAAILIDRCPAAIISAELQTDPNKFDPAKWFVATRSSIPTFDKYSVAVDQHTLAKQLTNVLERPIINSHYDHLILQIEPLVRQLVSKELESKLFIGVTDYVPKLCIIFYNGNNDSERTTCIQKVFDFCLEQTNEIKEAEEEEEEAEADDAKAAPKTPIVISLFVSAKKQESSFFAKNDLSHILHYPSESFEVTKQTKMIVTDFVHIVALCTQLGNSVSYLHLIVDGFNKCTGLAYTKTLFSTIIVSNMILLSPSTKLSSKVLKLLPTNTLSTKIFPGAPFDKIPNLATSHCLYFNKDINDAKFKPELISDRSVSCFGIRSRSSSSRSSSSRGTSISRASSSRSQKEMLSPLKTVSFHIALPPPLDEILTNRNPKLFETQKVHYMTATKEMNDFAQQIIKNFPTQKRLWYDVYAGGSFSNFSVLADLQCSFSRKGRWEIVKNESLVQAGVCNICQCVDSKNPVAVFSCNHTYCSACLLSFINNVSDKKCPRKDCFSNPLKVILCKHDDHKIAEIPIGESSDLFYIDSNVDDDCSVNLCGKEEFLFQDLKKKKTIIFTEHKRIIERYNVIGKIAGGTVFNNFEEFLTCDKENALLIVSYFFYTDTLIEEKSKILEKDVQIVLNDISPQSMANVLKLNEAFPSALEFLLYDFGLDRLLFFQSAREISLLEKDLILYDVELKKVIETVLSFEDVTQIINFVTAEDKSTKWRDIPRSTYSMTLIDETIELQYGSNGHLWKICPHIKVVKFAEQSCFFTDIKKGILFDNLVTHKRFFTDIGELKRMIAFANSNRFFFVLFF